MTRNLQFVIVGAALVAAATGAYVLARPPPDVPMLALAQPAGHDRGIVLAQLTQAPAPLAAPVVTFAEVGAFSPAQRLAIESVVRDYLLANPNIIREYLLTNPEVLEEAVAALEAKKRDAQQVQQVAALATYRDKLENSDRHVVLGNPEGDVTLIEFFDYNCTFCKRSLADVDRLMAEDPNLRVVLKEFPVLGPGSIEAAQVAVAVNLVAPDKYSAFHDMLLGGQAPASTDRALIVAEAVGIDVTKVRVQLADTATIERALEESFEIADALGLSGTPTYVLANEVVVGAVGYDALKARIDAVRACGSTVC